jgi:LPXTG-site transpeptidase (sortase) family protein
MLESVHKLLSKLRNNTPLIIIGIGVSLLLTSGVHSTWRDRSLRLRAEEVSEFAAPQSERKPSAQKISIPWRVETPIRSGEIQNGKWSLDTDAATHLSQSANPGEAGNIVIYGHNTREILGNIRVLVPGEKITLTTEDGSQHLYEVEWTKEVPPSDVSAVQPTDSEMLTLFTCSGFLDSQRFVVRAKPVLETPTPTE